MKLNDIIDGEADAVDTLHRLVGKKNLSNSDKAKASGLLAKIKAKRHNPKPGQDLQVGSHINDPFAGDGDSGVEQTVGTSGSGASRY